MQVIAGRFYRIVYKRRVDDVLKGTLSPEGRFHHSGQPALYCSPSTAAAGHAIAAYVSTDDPARTVVPLELSSARILDIRSSATCQELGIAPDAPSIPWQPERLRGPQATTWSASDAARQAGADGMIYAARSQPRRWHLVLFRWNAPVGARLRIAGPARDWHTPA